MVTRALCVPAPARARRSDCQGRPAVRQRVPEGIPLGDPFVNGLRTVGNIDATQTTRSKLAYRHRKDGCLVCNQDHRKATDVEGIGAPRTEPVRGTLRILHDRKWKSLRKYRCAIQCHHLQNSSPRCPPWKRHNRGPRRSASSTGRAERRGLARKHVVRRPRWYGSLDCLLATLSSRSRSLFPRPFAEFVQTFPPRRRRQQSRTR